MDIEDGTCNKDLLSLIGNTPVINIMASTYLPVIWVSK